MVFDNKLNCCTYKRHTVGAGVGLGVGLFVGAGVGDG